MSNEMSVLATGGAGYIGSHLSHRLADLGEPAVVLDNLSTGFRWAVQKRTTPLVVGDIGDQDLVSRIIDEHRVDAIIHFAGSIVAPESVADPLGYYLNNTVKSRASMATAVDKGVRHFIFSSQVPVSPYGSSKLMTETMLADTAAAHDFHCTALRYFNVAGADPNGRTGQSTKGATHLIKVACEAAQGKRSHLDGYGTDYRTPDGTCVHDYIHVSDLAKAHSDALSYLRSGGRSIMMN
jgi:UDP-glucose 4-epimerase